MSKPDHSVSLRELLAVIEHEQWVQWAKEIMFSEPISKGRKDRWADYFKPYQLLPEEVKEQHRKWADKALQTISKRLPKRYIFSSNNKWAEGYNACLSDIKKLLEEDV